MDKHIQANSDHCTTSTRHYQVPCPIDNRYMEYMVVNAWQARLFFVYFATAKCCDPFTRSDDDKSTSDNTSTTRTM